MIGRTLSHYRILAKLGEGGMGEVYRAEDMTLKRQVALKVLPPALAADPDRLDRFQREAEALAALDHPNIVTIFSVESADAGEPLVSAREGTSSSPTRIRFLTMQLVEGRPLSEMIPPGGMGLERIFEIAVPLADALAAAHQKGVVHRDLKPANIMVSDEGRVKVLDFGLAKLLDPGQKGTGLSLTQAMTDAMTEEGMIVGTMPYMSPEQLQGKELDPRTDIFSLGVILYEVAMGERPFLGESSADLVSSILRDVPAPIDERRAELPHHLGRIVSRCLKRDPQARFQTARDVCNELEDLCEEVRTSTSRVTAVRSAEQEDQSDIRSVAVLPLDNLSGDDSQEYFADGMTEALITDLSKIGALKVISRTSVMQYKEVRKPLPEIAQELSVDAVIEGSVLKAGERVRITAQLIDARSDQHIWAENYDRDLRDILGVMSEVAHSVAEQVRVQLTAQERSLLGPTKPVDPEAHEAYLKGKYLLSRLDREGVDRAIELMQAAIEIDPSYAQAHAGLADCYLTLVLFGWVDYPEGLPRVRAAALEALRIDNLVADAHAALASADARQRRYEMAEQGFQRAIQLSPNHARAHGDYAMLLIWINRLEEAIVTARRAFELEPLSLKAGIDLTFAFYYSRRYEDAERQIRKVLEIHPKAPYAEFGLACVLAQQERYDEAIETFLGRQVPTAATNWALGYVYGITGRHEEARSVLEFLHQRSKDQFISPDMMAYVHLGLGEKDKALELLEETCKMKTGRLIYSQVDPWFDALRDEPQFQDFVRRMKFPLPEEMP